MNQLEIDIDNTCFEPEQTINGKLHWRLEKPPKEIALSIGWLTEGKGTQDQKIEFEKVIISEFNTGTEFFSFHLPASPYSFAGTLIELCWFIDARTKKGDYQAHLDIVVAPEGKRVDL